MCIVELGETGDVFAVQRRELLELGIGSALMAYGQDVAIGVGNGIARRYARCADKRAGTGLRQAGVGLLKRGLW